MTTISAKSILASRHAITGKRIDTLLCRLPRWIHAEGRTHRLLEIFEGFGVEVYTPSLMDCDELSRNAGSSRAVPVAKLIKDVMEDTAVPLYWGANQKGMQAAEETNAPVYLPLYDSDPGHMGEYTREEAWIKARDLMIEIANAFAEAGYHKQIVNRLLEPFSHITVLVTATEWSNFFALRDHADAEPHIRMLAQVMRVAMDVAKVQTLQPGEWHLPFVDTQREENDSLSYRKTFGSPMLRGMQFLDLREAQKLSVACCASTSYKTVDGFDMTLDRAIALHDKLVASTPLHASPAEHVAQADDVRETAWLPDRTPVQWAYQTPKEHGNFAGFRQYRKMLPGESQ